MQCVVLNQLSTPNKKPDKIHEIPIIAPILYFHTNTTSDSFKKYCLNSISAPDGNEGWGKDMTRISISVE
jgi:hypothetical protein